MIPASVSDIAAVISFYRKTFKAIIKMEKTNSVLFCVKYLIKFCGKLLFLVTRFVVDALNNLIWLIFDVGVMVPNH